MLVTNFRLMNQRKDISRRILSIWILICPIISCTNKKDIRIRLADAFAEGDINKDTVFNGLIKFYDTASNQLIQTSNYKAGILDGDRIDYYADGKKKLQTQYIGGKINGEINIFDTAGGLSKTQHMYFDLRVGPTIEYKNKNVSQYNFYSLENKELLHFNYDSIAGKRIEQLNDTSFFFWHYNDYTTSENITNKKELFLYLPNPPRFNFQYSLCIITTAYDIRKTVKVFERSKSWDVIDLNYATLKADESFAIKLTVDNEFDSDDRIATMFKRL